MKKRYVNERGNWEEEITRPDGRKKITEYLGGFPINKNKERICKEPLQAINLQKLAQPLIKYMHDNYNPHVSIVITNERIAVIEDVLSIPNKGID